MTADQTLAVSTPQPQFPRHLSLQSPSHFAVNPSVFITTEGKLVTRYSSDFIHTSTIGHGGFGEVYLARSRIDDVHYAVKRIPF
ncbi:hypothetical protein GEMRC1_012690 [Eukaryota sp. GEM-RC1]